MPQEEEDKPDEATDEAKDEAKDEAELLEAKTDWCDFLLLQNVASERTAVNPRNSKWFFHAFFVGPCGASRLFSPQAGGRHERHELAEGEELIFENERWGRRRRSRRRQLGCYG